MFRRKRPAPKPLRDSNRQPLTGRGWIDSPGHTDEGTFAAFDSSLRIFRRGGDTRVIPWTAIAWVRVQGQTSYNPHSQPAHPWVFQLATDGNMIWGLVRPSHELFLIAPPKDQSADQWVEALEGIGVVIKLALR